MLRRIFTQPEYRPLESSPLPSISPLDIKAELGALVMRFELDTLTHDQTTNSSQFVPITFGAIKIKLDRQKSRFRFGREILTRALWSNPDFLANHPFMFSNITPLSLVGGQFEIRWENNAFFLYPGAQSINSTILRIKKNNDIEEAALMAQVPLNIVESADILGDYGLDKEKITSPHKIKLKISFLLPNNLQEIMSGV